MLVSGRVDLILCLVQRARYPNQFWLQKVPVQRWEHSIISSKKQTGFNTQVVDLKLSELQKVPCDDHPNWFYDDTLSPPKQKLKDQAILREIMSFFWVPVKCPGSHPQINGLNSWTSNKLRSPPPALVGGWFPPTHPKKIWTSNLIISGPGVKIPKIWMSCHHPGARRNEEFSFCLNLQGQSTFSFSWDSVPTFEMSLVCQQPLCNDVDRWDRCLVATASILGISDIAGDRRPDQKQSTSRSLLLAGHMTWISQAVVASLRDFLHLTNLNVVPHERHGYLPPFQHLFDQRSQIRPSWPLWHRHPAVSPNLGRLKVQRLLGWRLDHSWPFFWGGNPRGVCFHMPLAS